MPHVRQPPGRREPPGEPHRGADDDRGRPTHHHRIGVEQRHRHVADVVGRWVRPRGSWAQVLNPAVTMRATSRARDQDPALRADHRLGCGRRAAGEDERPGPVESGLGVGVGVVDVRQRTLERVAHHQHVVELVEHGGDQVVVSRLVDHQTAVGVADVVQQVGAAAGVVDTDHGGAGEGRTAEGEEVLRDVVEEDADVERAPRTLPGQEEIGPTAGLPVVLGVRHHPVLEADGGAAPDVGVVGVAPQQRGRTLGR